MTFWHDIDWKKCFQCISCKQMQLVEATRQNETQIIQKLQKEIVNSFEGRAVAVRRVSTNKGKNTPGRDKIQWKNPDDKWNAIKELGEITQNPQTYKASPVKRVWIPKADGSKRPLGIPTLIDRSLQATYQLALDPVAEVQSDIHSYGFRKYRSAHHAMARIRTLLDKRHSPEWILDADIEKCYDKICHKFLMKNVILCDKETILSQWLKSGVMEKDMFEESEGGTPQGSILSPTLANITLTGMEKAILFDHQGNPRKKVHLVRYADDFIITGTKYDELCGEIMRDGSEFLERRGLRYKEAKTNVRHISEGFDFLGFTIRRFPRDLRRNKRDENQKTVLIIKPQKKKIQVFKDKIKAVIHDRIPMGRMIKELNPLIRGWANYYRISYHSIEIFWTLGHFIYTSLWRWARRKHLRRKAEWIYKRYVREREGLKWNFINPEDEKQQVFNINKVKKLDVRPIKGEMIPYSREGEKYFEKKNIERHYAKFRNQVYLRAKHKCPHCEQSLYGEETVELHHIKPLKDGGKWSLQNIIPLHQTCHIAVTHGREKKSF